MFGDLLFILIFLMIGIYLLRRINIICNFLPLAIIFWIPLYKVGENNITLLDTLIVYITIASVINIASKKYFYGIVNEDVSLALIIILLSILIGLSGSLGLIFNGKGILDFLISLGLYLKKWGLYTIIPLIFLINNKKLNINFLLKLSLFIFIIILIYALKTFNSNNLIRSSSLLYNPNVFAAFYLIGANISTSAIFYKVNDKLIKFMSFVILLSFIIVLIISASRSATIGAFFSAFYWAYRSKIEKKQSIFLTISMLLTFTILFGISFNMNLYINRWKDIILFGLDSPGAAFRIDAVKTGLIMAKDSPFFGYGFGNVTDLSFIYTTKHSKYIDYLSTTDNIYLDILLDSGAFGLLCFLFTIYLIWKKLNIKLNSDKENYLKAGLKASLIALIIIGLFGQSFYSPFISSYFWLLFSICLVSSNKLKERISTNYLNKIK